MTIQTTMLFTEQVQPLAVIHSVGSTGALTSAYVNVESFHRIVALLDIGAMSQTQDFEILQATDTTGAGSKGIPTTAAPEKKITQLTGGDDDNTIYAINLRTDELDVDGGFCCVAIKATAGGATNQISAWLLGLVARYEPVADTAWGEVIS